MQENKPSAETPEELLQVVAEQSGNTPLDEAAPEATGETMPSLEESLRQAELKAAEHHDAWLRAKADAENIRRRAQEDITKASKFASEKFANAMLPVKDSLEAALTTDNQTLESLREGVELTLKQLAAAFQSAGVTDENPVGSKFDPNRHQAIAMIEADGEPNTVVTVLQKGYLLHERVLRPAMVTVSKGKSA
ncbi:nucleotide exchange factor GrpE [Aromatoleum toluclasticum]|uniref:nucleotide exchange factor GrpE n=1 Tax=Aromatoleum toluclasticum TaxID=92003 RepID=UPI001D17F9FE|nr:nucleotide exchange factor GrpE [Aromatoleum toluclasticum]MCC4116725.1 nucleotide exchange factor GrpE [Aromatoleum toluclasticum]